MSPESWMLFALKELLLCLTPGPAVLLVVFQGMGLGHRASVAGNIGVLSGNATYFLISALVFFTALLPQVVSPEGDMVLQFALLGR